MLTLWRPREDPFRWSRELDRLFECSPNEETLQPAVDVVEEEHRYVLTADLPGFDQKNIDVRVSDGALVLSGKREESRESKRGTVTYAERRHGSFSRQFALGSSVDEGKIEATYQSGVLTVVLPKKDEAKPRQIPVHTS
jgi:HSP20 family protein